MKIIEGMGYKRAEWQKRKDGLEGKSSIHIAEEERGGGKSIHNNKNKLSCMEIRKDGALEGVE